MSPPPPPPPPLLFEDPWKTWTIRLDGDDSHLIGKVNPVDKRRPCLELVEEQVVSLMGWKVKTTLALSYLGRMSDHDPGRRNSDLAYEPGRSFGL